MAMELIFEVVVLAAAVGCFLELRAISKTLRQRPVPQTVKALQSFLHGGSTSEIKVFDASGKFRFRRPPGHPDLEEVAAMPGWRCEVG